MSSCDTTARIPSQLSLQTRGENMVYVNLAHLEPNMGANAAVHPHVLNLDAGAGDAFIVGNDYGDRRSINVLSNFTLSLGSATPTAIKRATWTAILAVFSEARDVVC